MEVKMTVSGALHLARDFCQEAGLDQTLVPLEFYGGAEVVSDEYVPTGFYVPYPQLVAWAKSAKKHMEAKERPTAVSELRTLLANATDKVEKR